MNDEDILNDDVSPNNRTNKLSIIGTSTSGQAKDDIMTRKKKIQKQIIPHSRKFISVWILTAESNKEISCSKCKICVEQK